MKSSNALSLPVQLAFPNLALTSTLKKIIFKLLHTRPGTIFLKKCFTQVGSVSLETLTGYKPVNLFCLSVNDDVKKEL